MATKKTGRESRIHYGGNKDPEPLTCCREESSVATGRGYSKVAGKPLLSMVHGTAGVADPKDIAPAIKRAIQIVKRGEPF